MEIAPVSEVLFPEGMVGCPEWRRFTLTPDPDDGPVLLLQSLDQPEVSLLVTPPETICPGYRPRLGEEDLAALGLADAAEARLYCVLTVRRNPLVITANLLGPIVVNPTTGAARQVVLAESSYSSRYPVVGQAPEPKAPSPTAEPSRQGRVSGRRLSVVGLR